MVQKLLLHSLIMKKAQKSIQLFILIVLCEGACVASNGSPKIEFKAIAFFTARHDPAHISFVREANAWFQRQALANSFVYDTTSDWNNLNSTFLSRYQVVIFLDTRPESKDQRVAFEKYIKSGGAWLGFHFAAFALNESKYPDDWTWYHDEFIGAGQYKSNTWRPTAETLHVDAADHPTCKGLPESFESAPNEWYCWEKDLRNNSDIEIILSLHPSTFPVGTGPKAHEIWHSGFYPVAWANKKYRMIYLNMGHNDMDYGGTEKELSSTFSSAVQGRFILQSLVWLGHRD
jgi:uncharacterized protein